MNAISDTNSATQENVVPPRAAKQLAFVEYGKVEDWEVQDPYGSDPVLYQTIYEDIQRKVVQLAERLRGAVPKGIVAKSGGEVIGAQGK